MPAPWPSASRTKIMARSTVTWHADGTTAASRKSLSERLDINLAPVHRLQLELAPTACNLSPELRVAAHRIADEPRRDGSIDGVLLEDANPGLSVCTCPIRTPACRVRDGVIARDLELLVVADRLGLIEQRPLDALGVAELRVAVQ